MYKLFGRPGWGSTLVEAQLAWYGLPYEIEEVDDLFASAEAREKLRVVNPLAQIPTLILPDGQQVSFPIDSFAKHCLINGLDQLGFLQAEEPAITAYELAHSAGVRTV